MDDFPNIPVTGTLRVYAPDQGCYVVLKLRRSSLRPHPMLRNSPSDFISFDMEMLWASPLRFTCGHMTHAQYIDLQAGYPVDALMMASPIRLQLR